MSRFGRRPVPPGPKALRGPGSAGGVLHIDGKGQLERFAPESCFEGGQLLLRLPLRDRTGVVIAAHRDAPRRARGIVALEGRVNVGLAALAAQHPQHHAVDFAAFLTLSQSMRPCQRETSSMVLGIALRLLCSIQSASHINSPTRTGIIIGPNRDMLSTADWPCMERSNPICCAGMMR